MHSVRDADSDEKHDDGDAIIIMCEIAFAVRILSLGQLNKTFALFMKSVLLVSLLPMVSRAFAPHQSLRGIHISSSRQATGAARFSRDFSSLGATSRSIPSLEQVSSDPFMKQVEHAAKLVSRIQDDSDDQLVSLLKAQLSHSDGIRGFMVTYLTGQGENHPADQDNMPVPLLQALEEVDSSDLIPLACMNVIMPTAMVTMHSDPNLSAQSKQTAVRGARVLTALKCDALVENHCRAIEAVAIGGKSSDDIDSAKLSYWTEFFDKWGYQEKQREDIAKAIRDVYDKLD